MLVSQINLCSLRNFPKNKAEVLIEHPKGTIISKFSNTKNNSVNRVEDIKSNVAGVISNENGCMFTFNIIPDIQHNQFDKIRKTLNLNYEKIKDLGDNLWGFITGGWNLDMRDALAVKSYETYNMIADTFDKFEIPFGVLCGKKIDSPVENFRCKNNKLYAWSDNFADKFQNGSKHKEIISNLEDVYETVEFPDEIELNVYNELPSSIYKK